MLFSATTFAVLGLSSLSSAHMIMNTPAPYGKSTLNNSPLAADGSDFPCKQRSGVYSAEGASNSMALGSTQKLAFTGSATHGGGSCQISITYDQAPTKNSVFKVIHSIEGGCPIKNVAGNNGDDANSVDPDTYSFTVPSDLPTGSATLAWTWFNKVGNREMYMNCAPITITGGGTKRSEVSQRDTSAYNALPDMFVANVGNSCGTVDSQDLKFPNPGDSLELFGTATAQPVAPTGAGCASAGSGSGGGAAASSAAAPAATAPATLPGGVFITVATSATATPAAATPASEPASSAPAAAAPAPAASSAAPSAAPAPAPAAPASGSGAIAQGTACTTEGMWNCIGGTSFQQCASGMWSAVQSVAAGTTCASGQTMDINITAVANRKRAIRFSAPHVRRHVLRSS